MGSRRHFGIHAVVRQGDGIIARCRFLGGFVVFAFICIVFYIAAERKQQDVSQVWATRSVQVRLGKPFDEVVVVVISRAISPGTDTGFRTGLYQAKWGASTRKRMAVIRIPDKGVYIL